ncbi:MAG: hypothetical protein MJE66_03930 [Proteobacteria bacterium]|nr:hypothetical protein [Pseudomonadota bacterium]
MAYSIQLTGILVSVVVSAWVGVRLLVLARRTRQMPELAMGFYCTGVTLSAALYLTAGLSADRNFELARWFTHAGSAALCLSACALALGLQRIYRARVAWASWLSVALCAWIVSGWAWILVAEGAVLPGRVTVPNVVYTIARVSIYVWGAIEALRYHLLMRRRLKLGLADPIVAHRMLLWGAFMVCMASFALLMLVLGIVMGPEGARWLPGTSVAAALMFVGAFCLWCSFFPPAFYQRWIARRPRSEASLEAAA